jgi:hypothetical protein
VIAQILCEKSNHRETEGDFPQTEFQGSPSDHQFQQIQLYCEFLFLFHQEQPKKSSQNMQVNQLAEKRPLIKLKRKVNNNWHMMEHKGNG